MMKLLKEMWCCRIFWMDWMSNCIVDGSHYNILIKRVEFCVKKSVLTSARKSAILIEIRNMIGSRLNIIT